MTREQKFFNFSWCDIILEHLAAHVLCIVTYDIILSNMYDDIPA